MARAKSCCGRMNTKPATRSSPIPPSSTEVQHGDTESFLFRSGPAVVERDPYPPPVVRGLRLPMATLIDAQIDDAGVAIMAQPAPRLRFGDLALARGALLAAGSG